MSRTTRADLDRCTHGRHEGDSCLGWRGPAPQDGGCQGGISLGNPYSGATTGRIGTTIYGVPILPDDLLEDDR